MKLIGLQAGHQNITSNPNPILAGETGAAGEEPLNVRVRDRLGQILIAHGFVVQLDDANANIDSNTTDKDFDFYLAIHAEGEPQGGAISAPDPNYDQVNQESKRICAAIESVYFQETQIRDNVAIISLNMTEYYMWDALSGPTPCGIIEMGALADAHDSVLLANTELIAGAIAKGICKAFDVPFDPVAPTPPVVIQPMPIPVPQSTVTPNPSPVITPPVASTTTIPASTPQNPTPETTPNSPPVVSNGGFIAHLLIALELLIKSLLGVKN